MAAERLGHQREAQPEDERPEPGGEERGGYESARSVRCGSSPISIVPRPNMPIVPSSAIAEMAADP